MRGDPAVDGAAVAAQPELGAELVGACVVEVLHGAIVVAGSDAENQTLAAFAAGECQLAHRVAQGAAHGRIGRPDAPGARHHISQCRYFLKQGDEMGIGHGPQRETHRHQRAAGRHAHHATAVAFGHCHSQARRAVVVAGTGLHIGIPVDDGVGAAAQGGIQTGHHLAIALEVGVGQVKAIVGHGDDDVAPAACGVPGFGGEDARTSDQVGPGRRCMQMPLAAEQFVCGDEEALQWAHQVRFSVNDIT